MARPGFRDVFGQGKVILPVIHVEGLEQATRNAEIALRAGANGVFLIGHGMDWLDLAAIWLCVRSTLPELWVGLNMLDVKAKTAMSLVDTRIPCAGLWADNARIEESMGLTQVEARRVQEARGQWEGLYFGGVAFKGQREVADADLATAARLAAPYMDVVTTSGPGTGLPASVDKLRKMKTALGRHPLAVASGVTLQNVDEILPHVDCILVASGISFNFSELDPAKTADLVARVRG